MDYTYVFSDFIDVRSQVQVINHRTGEAYCVHVHINDAEFRKTDEGWLTPLLADLVDLAASIYVSDWLLPKSQHKRYDIGVVLPLRNPLHFSRKWVIDELQKLLQWYTDDNWHFEFTLRNCRGRETENHAKFPLFSDLTEVALWSGGLDSLAGLCGQIQTRTAPQYTLFGTGSNTTIQGKQADIACRLKSTYPQIKLIQLPIQLQYPDKKPPSNDTFRARGFVFKLLGAICSCLERQSMLHIYENGFGAINLPFTLSETGIAHTRSVHPISLIKTGKFLSQLLGIQFEYKNPYLFSTKAQICNSIRLHSDLAFDTVSCDGRYRQPDQPTQCGSCSSCLLRRMALLIALGGDRTKYVITDGIVTQPLLQRSYFEAMDFQVDALNKIFSSEEPWLSLLQRYPDLRKLQNSLTREDGKSNILVQDCLLHLYQSHANEWGQVQHLLKVRL